MEPGGPGEANVIHASCIDDDAQGQPLQALWEMELDAEIRGSESWNKLSERGFDPPEQFAAYLNTLRWNCVTSTDARLFARLPEEIAAGVDLDAIAKAMSERFRQQIIESGLQDSAALLRGTDGVQNDGCDSLRGAGKAGVIGAQASR